MKKQSNGSTTLEKELQKTDGEPHDEYYFERQKSQSYLDRLEEEVQKLEDLSEGIFEEWLNYVRG